MTDNPFHAPYADPAISKPLRVMCWSTVSFILLVGVIGAGIAGSGGLLVGWLAPEYYQQLFNSNGNPEFKPMLFGAVIGCMQGLGSGILLGFGLAVIQAWLDSRIAIAIDRANRR